MIFYTAVFGAIIGSFLNALSFRWGTGSSILKGRSSCMQCRHTLSWLDLVPVFSFLWLRGRCRYCSSKISVQYVLVEVAAVVLSIGTYMSTNTLYEYLFWFVIWMTLLFIAIYDLRHQIIPPSASVFLAVLSLGYVLLVGGEWWSGPVLALPLFVLSAVSGGQWMGWADSGLELSLGWLIGITLGLSAFMLAFWIGAIVGIALMMLSKRVTMRTEVPFAPFLIVGFAISYFFHVDFFSTLPLLFV